VIVSIVLACVTALIFAVLGTAKILALPPMREAAVRSGFSTAAYRRIGALELAGAVGVAVGPAVELFGGLAGAGLLLLLTGALITHMRHRDEPRAAAPAVVCAALVAGYLAALLEARP
jgi:hypothetical protein